MFFKAYREWKSAERAADRQVILEAVGMLKAAFDAQRAQSDAFKEFLEGFKVSSPTEVRPWDEQLDDARFLEARGLVPEELKDLAPPDQFRSLMHKLDQFQLDI